jgi:hypothetical protein
MNGLLAAMDNLSFHFYAIELPVALNKPSDVAAMTKQQLLQHWTTFGGWFEGFDDPADHFDTWLKAKLTSQVKLVDALFKKGASIPALFQAYRNLLDTFQFMLQILATGQSEPLPTKKAEHELQILENLIDLLVTFVFRNQGEDIRFTEFEPLP